MNSCPDTYSAALVIRDQRERNYLEAVAAHREACGSEKGLMGLTPDHVKSSLAWRTTRAEMDAAQRRLADYNRVFLKRFKREWKATLEERRASRTR